MRPDVRAVLNASVREAFRQGTAGPVHDLPLLARYWGFDPERVAAPLQVWHGEQDGVVPPEMSKALVRKAPNAQLRLLPDEGHVSITVRHGAVILETLVDRATRNTSA